VDALHLPARWHNPGPVQWSGHDGRGGSAEWTDEALAQANRETCDRYARAEHLWTPRETFNKCLGHNVGIRALGTELIGAIDVDMILPPEFTAFVQRKFAEGCEFLMPRVGWLPEGVDYSLPFDALCELADFAEHRGGRWGAGSPQVARREWWHRVHGFDEGFDGTLGGTETELMDRARRDWLRVCRPMPPEVWVLHQWHPQSPLKYKRRYYEQECKGRADVVVNGEDWGRT